MFFWAAFRKRRVWFVALMVKTMIGTYGHPQQDLEQISIETWLPPQDPLLQSLLQSTIELLKSCRCEDKIQYPKRGMATCQKLCTQTPQANHKRHQLMYKSFYVFLYIIREGVRFPEFKDRSSSFSNQQTAPKDRDEATATYLQEGQTLDQ